jgi:hypothetical protein
LVTYLVGSGHFAFGFSLGFLIMLATNKIYHKSINVQMYSPFLPFIIGIWAAIPYLFIYTRELDSFWINIFILYSFIHHNEMLITIFGRLYLVTLICGLMYIYMLIRYISLVKYCRRYGWNK